jgi:PAS domain S-box-containing protein
MSITRNAGSFVRGLLAAPVLGSEQQTHEARTLHRVAWLLMTTVVVFLLAAALEQPATLPRRLVSMAVVVVSCVVPLALSRRGRTRLANWVMIGGISTIVVLRIWTSGGLNAPSTSALVIIVIMGGLLLDTLGAVIVCVGCAAIGLVMFVAQRNGVLTTPSVYFSPLGLWLNSCMWLALAAVLQRLTGTQLREALRRTETELRTRQEAQHRLSLALDAGNIGVWDQDATTKAMIGDSRWLELLGLTRSPDGSVAYQTWASRVHPDDLGAIESTLWELARGATDRRLEFRVVRPGGVVRNVESCATVLLDASGQPSRIVGVNVDVTERKQAEAEHARLLHDLTERVKELRLLHAAARLLQHDRGSNPELFQDLVDRIPGAWQFPECCEARITFRDIVAMTPGWRDSPWRQSTSFTTSAGDGVIDVVYLTEQPPAHEGPFLAEERTLIDSLADLLVSYVELREHQDRLERLVETRTRELRVAKDEAERANLAKTTFLANMSHEIRTPLNAVLGYAQLLRRDRALGEPQRERINAILSSGNHLVTVINDVLEMSKIEAGHASLVADRVNPRAMLRDLEQMFSGLVATRSNTLEFVLDGELPRFIRADGAKLRQVVINLLSNAAKFTERGQIRVRTSHRSGAERDAFTIVVEDTGPGIEASDQVRIFEKFEQSERGKRTGGTGLGLAISRHFARLMDGDLTVASTPGQGSAFTFTFVAEVVEADLAAAEPDATTGSYPTGIDAGDTNPKILVVDDYAPNRCVAEELLMRVGFEVRAVHSGEEAIAAHDLWKPDLILMDLRMPGIGGIEATRRLRAGGCTSVIIALTGSGFDDARRDGLEAGVTDVMVKPYLENALLQRIATLLGIRYVYSDAAARHTQTGAIAIVAETPGLSLLLKDVPLALRGPLREAVVRVRPQRIEGLAAQINEHSAEAAARIRALAQDFNYDGIIRALDAAAS